MLHNKTETTLVSKKGQRNLLCSNKKVCRCPFLEFSFIENQANLDKAYDVLFDEILLVNKKDEYYNQKIDSDIR